MNLGPTPRAFIVARIELGKDGIPILRGAGLFSEDQPEGDHSRPHLYGTLMTGYGNGYMEGIEDLRKQLEADSRARELVSSLLVGPRSVDSRKALGLPPAKPVELVHTARLGPSDLELCAQALNLDIAPAETLLGRTIAAIGEEMAAVKLLLTYMPLPERLAFDEGHLPPFYGFRWTEAADGSWHAAPPHSNHVALTVERSGAWTVWDREGDAFATGLDSGEVEAAKSHAARLAFNAELWPAWYEEPPPKRIHVTARKSWVISEIQRCGPLEVLGLNVTKEAAIAMVKEHPTEFLSIGDPCDNRDQDGRCLGHDD